MRTSAALLLVGALAAAGQQPPFIETYEVRVSNLDVIVTDRAGQPVHEIPREAFEVRENGVVQPITNFSEYSSSSAIATRPAAPTDSASPAPAPADAPPPRKWVFLVDELSLHPVTRSKLLQSALQVVDSLRDNDVATVVTVASAQKVVLPFTNDKPAVRKSLQAAFDQGGFRADTRLERERIFYENQVQRTFDMKARREMARLYALRVSDRVRSTLTAMRALIASLGTDSGRKMLVVLTESLSAQPGREAFTVEDTLEAREFAPASAVGAAAAGGDQPIAVNDQMGKALWFDARPMIKEIGALATASGITVYSIQPALGLHLGVGGTADQRATQARMSASLAVSELQRTVADDTRAALTSLAEDTGGKVFVGESEFSDAFRQVVSDAGSYYSLGFRPADRSTAVRDIDVRIRDHPEYTVRFGRSLMRESPTHQMNDLVAASLLYPKALDELSIAVSATKPVRDGKRFKVNVSVAVPLAKLTFVPAADVQRAIFTVHYAAAGEDVAFHTGFDRQQGIEVSNTDFAEAKTHAFTYTTTLAVTRGATTIAVAVQDPLSRKASFKTISVDAR